MVNDYLQHTQLNTIFFAFILMVGKNYRWLHHSFTKRSSD